MEKSQLTRGIDDFWNGPSLVGCFLYAHIEKDSRLGFRHLIRRQITSRTLILGEMMAESLIAQLRRLRDELDDLKKQYRASEDKYKQLESIVSDLKKDQNLSSQKINTLSGSRIQYGHRELRWIDVTGDFEREQGFLIIDFRSDGSKTSQVCVAPVRPANV